MDTEREKLQNKLLNLKNKNHLSKEKFEKDNCENNESPNTNRMISPNFTDSVTSRSEPVSPMPGNNNETYLNVNSVNPIHYVDIIEFEKLKEDYFSLYEEKKALEIQLLDSFPYEDKYKQLVKKYNELQILYETANSKTALYYEEKLSLQDRLNKLSKENFELVTNINSLKESLNSSEKDKNGAKSKITAAHNKIKMLEKETASLRKKTQSLNFQIKDLKEKLKDRTDEKILIGKKLEDVIEEFENKLVLKENEKQKILKDSLSHLMNLIDEDKCFEFSYNINKDLIEIYFEKSKIIEVENKVSNVSNPSDVKLNTENSILYLKTNNTETLLTSPSKPQNKFSKDYIFTDNDPETCKSASGVSLQKLFSNKSRSSQKIKKNDSSNKENVNLFGNLLENNNQNKNRKILLGNLSSSKRNKKTFYSKLAADEMENLNNKKNFFINNNHYYNVNMNVNPFESIDSCIRKTNLNNNLRYILSSNNRHKKVISLGEMMGVDEDDNKDEGNSIVNNHSYGNKTHNNKSPLDLMKKLDFHDLFSISKNTSLEIIQSSKREASEVVKDKGPEVIINSSKTTIKKDKVISKCKNSEEEDPTILPYKYESILPYQ